ncbi:hypothetical protein BASA81_008724 [Batrachochytrium salamandrivorans]|nr:hypothetical protein BASA81_008724 [Batrachochytrium salamandrivorans]
MTTLQLIKPLTPTARLAAKPKRLFAKLSTKLLALLLPGNHRQLSVLQLKFALVIEHFMHQKAARAGQPDRKDLVTSKDLCLHHHCNELPDFGWVQVPAFVCLGCLKPQKKRTLLGCRKCAWEVCVGCREKIFALLQSVTCEFENDFALAMQTFVPKENLKQAVKWAESTNTVRPQVARWLRVALVPNTAIFTLLAARGMKPRPEQARPPIARLPQELLRMVAQTLGPQASWSL